MSEEIAETVEAEAEVQANEEVEAEPIDVDALADERLEAESQRQLQAFMQDHGLDTPEETTEEDVQETQQEEEKEVAQAEPEAPLELEENSDAEEQVSETTPVSKSFVQIAKREREIYRRQQEIKQKEAELKRYEDIEQSVKQGDHLSALEKLGGSYQSATDQVLGREPESPQQADLAARVEKLETEKATLEANQKVADYVGRLKQVAESKEEYGLTASMWEEAQDIALETASQYASQTGQMLKDEQLLEMVENYYLTEGEKLMKHPRFAARFTAPAVAEEKPTTQQSVQRTRSRTLSSSTSRSAPAKPTRPLTQEERLERAASVLKARMRD
jgi:hypothetical protein